MTRSIGPVKARNFPADIGNGATFMIEPEWLEPGTALESLSGLVHRALRQFGI
jgi:hypothetical protein